MIVEGLVKYSNENMEKILWTFSVPNAISLKYMFPH